MVVTSRPDAPYGDHREFIRVRTNVPDMPFVEFEAFLNVVHDLVARPAHVNFRYVERNQVLKYKVRVRPTMDSFEFKVTGAEIDLPGFKAEVEEVIPNTEVFVHITGRPLGTSDPRAIEKGGRMTGTLRIFTDLESQPELQVSVTYLLKM